MCLQIELKKKGLSLRTWNHLLWDRYKNNPNEGISKQEFYAMLEAYAGDDIKDFFDDYITTTKEINFLQHFSSAGLEIVWEKDTWDLGVEVEFQGDRIIIKTVFEDGGGYRSGLNAQDEIIAINNLRILKSDWDWFIAQLQENIYYDITVARLGEIRHCQVLAAKSHPKIKTLKILDMETLKKVLEIES